MTPEVRKALEGSIAKWQAIVEGHGRDGGTEDCPLCQLFVRDRPVGERCLGCPVAQTTGLRGCAGSPYDLWAAQGPSRAINHLPEGLKPKARKLAQAELDFLQGLAEARDGD